MDIPASAKNAEAENPSDFAIPRWRPGDPLPVRADKTDMARIITYFAEPISPNGLKFHPLMVTRPGRANLFDVDSTLKYFRNRVATAGEYRLGTVRTRPAA